MSISVDKDLGRVAVVGVEVVKITVGIMVRGGVPSRVAGSARVMFKWHDRCSSIDLRTSLVP